MVIIETNRLYLRELSISDADDFYELNKDNDVMKYTGDKPFDSVEAAQVFLKNYKDYKMNGFGRWAVVLKEGETFIGWCGLKLNEENLIDVGFRFYKKYWNNGYASESAQAVLNYGFTTLQMTEIIGRVDQSNTASIRVLEKLGMKFWKQNKSIIYYKLGK